MTIIKIITSTILFLSFNSAAETAIFCDSCVNSSVASSVAKSYSPSLQCSSSDGGTPVFDEGLSCSSAIKKVTLINPSNGATYAFNVHHQSIPPWDVVAEVTSISTDANYAFSELAKFHRAWLSSIESAMIANNVNNNYTSKNTQPLSVSSTSTCPVGTALDTISDPSKLADLEMAMRLEIGMNYMSQNNNLNLNPRLNSEGYGVSYKGMQYSAKFGPLDKKPVYVRTFDVSENPSSMEDSLAFYVNIIGYNSDNMPLVNFELSDASLVAGYSLKALKGTNGPLLLDNPCIQGKLDSLVNNGALTKTTTPIGGSTPEPSPGGGGIGYQPSCQIVEFHQSGMHLYTFRLCR